jgi:DNA (cytosine-5)-methyltransferase 1
MTFNVVDLFTGIGGFSRALNDMFTPMLYCDNDPYVQQTLQRLMSDKNIPVAPIVNNVCNVDHIVRICSGHNVHLLTCGFPCTGFSNTGKRAGLNNPQSKMFHASIAVIEALQPNMVLFENVQSILSRDHASDLDSIVSCMHRMGYDMRWTVVSAADVGYPHRRKRWFALCLKTLDTEPPILTLNADVQTFKIAEPPLNAVQRAGHSQKFRMLGNSIVPLAARLAFCRLYTGYKIYTLYDLRQACVLVPCTGYDEDMCTNIVTSNVCAPVGGPKVYIRMLDVQQCPPIIVRMHEHQYKDSHKLSAAYKVRIQKSPRLTRGTRDVWPTPRSACAHASHILTARGLGDLPTCARFAVSIDDRCVPKTNCTEQISIQWVEWLMGYPTHWTKSLNDD